MNLHMMMAAVLSGGLPAWINAPYTSVNIAVFPAAVLAGIEIDVDGGVERYNQQGNQGDIGRWDGNNSLSKINFQFRYDVTAGSTPNGTSDSVGVWLAASASLDNWEQTLPSGGFRMSSGNLRVRLAASPFTEYASTTLLLQVESLP